MPLLVGGQPGVRHRQERCRRPHGRDRTAPGHTARRPGAV